MTVVVPFDGSALSVAALERATDIQSAFGSSVHAFTVVPDGNTEYARERGWLDAGERFDPERVVSQIAEQVETATPEATFAYDVVNRYAPSGVIANRIRRYARTEDATLVVIGSENAGRIVTSVSSVGSPVAADESYDVLLVRHERD